MATKDHATLASAFNVDEERVSWHDDTLWFIREKRDKASKKTFNWEHLRNLASQIKENVLSNLDQYLIQFEQNAQKNGVVVHWAKDAAEHNQIVLSLLQMHNITSMVKSKSMLTEECHLNEFLQHNGVEVIDTDLGERIVQLANEPPSHIVLPCIHKKKEEIGEIFHEHLGTPKGLSDPQELTEAARINLREKFLTRKVALTGVNFAVAETGEFVVCTNEGNADMGAHLADVHIASMGLEKIIPLREHLAVFLNLLARSATGQPITTYSSHFKQKRENQEMHIILVDNGRSIHLGREDFRNALKCIRCGACMNTCPVYRRSGGHSYHTAVAGPIGSILSPNLDMEKYKDLPFASTLCGSCTNVCPVKIDIHQQLYKWRQVIVQNGYTPKSKTAAMNMMALSLSKNTIYNMAGKSLRFTLKYIPFAINNSLNPWYKNREMPAAPESSFKKWYSENRKDKKMSSRIDILSAIAKNKPVFKPLPEILLEPEDGINLVEKFTENAVFVGAKVNQASSLDEVADYVQSNFKDSTRILTNNPAFEKLATLDQTTTLPHELENVDLAILDAHFGVAENGAIWVTEELLVQRVLPFITQHLILIVKNILPSMLDAYTKINNTNYGYGVFIAGPSKTADIEQSLVIGAHGARSLSIFILAEPA